VIDHLHSQHPLLWQGVIDPLEVIIFLDVHLRSLLQSPLPLTLHRWGLYTILYIHSTEGATALFSDYVLRDNAASLAEFELSEHILL